MSRPAPTFRQRGTLATLEAARNAISCVAGPVAAIELPLAAAPGRVLATDIRARHAVPEARVALRDGWAVAGADVAGAAASSPVPLPAKPSFVAEGDALPEGTDSVLAPPDVTWLGPFAEALAETAPGEGAAPAGFDLAAGALVAGAGTRLTAMACAALAAAGVEGVPVRVPSLTLVLAGARSGPDISGRLVAELFKAAGAAVSIAEAPDAADLADALGETKTDALVVIGRTGDGPSDHALRVLAECGDVLVDGVACLPAMSSAVGRVAGRPVICVPGRPDRALAGAILLGLPLLARLSGLTRPVAPVAMPLLRKLASPPGLAELRYVETGPEGATPLPAAPMPLGLLARANGYVLVSAGSEGFAPGETVPVYPLP